MRQLLIQEKIQWSQIAKLKIAIGGSRNSTDRSVCSRLRLSGLFIKRAPTFQHRFPELVHFCPLRGYNPSQRIPRTQPKLLPSTDQISEFSVPSSTRSPCLTKLPVLKRWPKQVQVCLESRKEPRDRQTSHANNQRGSLEGSKTKHLFA